MNTMSIALLVLACLTALAAELLTRRMRRERLALNASREVLVAEREHLHDERKRLEAVCDFLLTSEDAFSLDGYQTAAMRTHVDDPVRLPAYALGLAGESGEVADLIKKHIAHGHDLDLDKLKKELGDVLWYIAGIAHLHGMTLSEVAIANIDKLLKRYPDGFSHEASINRKDTE